MGRKSYLLIVALFALFGGILLTYFNFVTNPLCDDYSVSHDPFGCNYGFPLGFFGVALIHIAGLLFVYLAIEKLFFEKRKRSR